MDVFDQIFEDDTLSKVMASAITFLETTKIHKLPLPSKFLGSGVYLLYYTGKHEIYSVLNNIQNSGKRIPIYIGKAVPPGSRQGRGTTSDHSSLCIRLNEHARSIRSGKGLDLESFECRFVILNGEITNLISALESKLINLYQPIWNSCLDGFGNHDPGKGRYEQARSEWDTLHVGRLWAEKLNENPLKVEEIINKGKLHLKQVL